jgi:glycosyltransferase involved in cell wall biosynthesis
VATCGHDVELLCLAAKGEVSGVRLDVHEQWRAAGRFAFSPGFARALRHRAGRVDIVHNHSLWAMPSVAAGLVVPGSGTNLITSPRGTLSPWALAHSKWIKRAIWPLQRRALFAADLLHATSDAEFADIRAAGLTQPVVIIPNGIDVPFEVGSRVSSSGQRTLLFLGRIHPVKGVDLLLDSWRDLQSRHSDWRLVIAGGGERAYLKAMHEKAARLELKRVEFAGPVYGREKTDMYRAAHLFVLPTHSENFGMAVAEALAHGLPAVVSKGAPWQGLESQHCGWWVDRRPDAFVDALDHAMACSETQLGDKGRRGREWMRTSFKWDVIGRNMAEVYRWLLDGGVKPAWVRQD